MEKYEYLTALVFQRKKKRKKKKEQWIERSVHDVLVAGKTVKA